MHKFTLSLICTVLFFGFASAQSDEYKLVWAEEFDSGEINENHWSFETGGGGWGNKELQHYTARRDNSFIRDGKLVIKALLEEYEGNNFTSARLTTKSKVMTKYGKVEACIKFPKGKGTWPAFWMMPQYSEYGGWPRSGEIDIMEHVGATPEMVSYAIHTRHGNGSDGNNWFKKIYPGFNLEEDFHTHAIIWEDDRIEFHFDGVKQTTYWNDRQGDFKTWPFDKEFFVIVNLAIGGLMGGTVDENAFNSDVEMEVDYIRIYQKGGASIGNEKNDAVKVLYKTTSRTIDIEGLQGDATVSLYDLSGKKIKEIIANNDVSISADSFHKGIYLVLIEQNGIRTTHKIII
jgi:beta-glucanase (GH16 family)